MTVFVLLQTWCWAVRMCERDGRVVGQNAWPVILVLSAVFSSVSGHYTSQWAVHIPGGSERADHIAAKHGFINRGKVSLVSSNLFRHLLEATPFSKDSLKSAADAKRQLLT